MTTTETSLTLLQAARELKAERMAKESNEKIMKNGIDLALADLLSEQGTSQQHRINLAVYALRDALRQLR